MRLYGDSGYCWREHELGKIFHLKVSQARSNAHSAFKDLCLVLKPMSWTYKYSSNTNVITKKYLQKHCISFPWGFFIFFLQAKNCPTCTGMCEKWATNCKRTECCPHQALWWTFCHEGSQASQFMSEKEEAILFSENNTECIMRSCHALMWYCSF